METELEEIFSELEARRKEFKVETFCFREQIHFIRDKKKYKTAVCSRRAGKTIAVIAYLISIARSKKGTACLYLTLSRLNAKRIVWGELLRINREFNLGGVPNETELCLRFPENDSIIYLSGAKDKTEIEKFRGLPLILAVIDESQAFRSYIQELVDDVLSKSLYDYDGTLCLIGTPGPIPSGYFYDASQSEEWSHHSWTMVNNPYLEIKSGKKPIELIEQDCKRMGVGLEEPKIQRECFGKWIVDSSSLVFKYSAARNDYKTLPLLDQYVIGVDLGFSDADAIAVIGWAKYNPKAYLVEEVVKAKQGVTELAESLAKLIAKYDPLSVVMDTGGLGKKIAEELRKRYSLPIKAAEKVRKFEYIELLNDALRTERLFARAGGAFAQDAFLVEWDKDRSSGDRLVVSDSYHSDITDAVLYGFRESLHWTEIPQLPKPKAGTPEWFSEEEDKLVKDIEMNLAKAKEEMDPAAWPEPDGGSQWE